MKRLCLLVFAFTPLFIENVSVADALKNQKEEVFDVRMEVRAKTIAGLPIDEVIKYISEYDELAINEYLRTGVLPSVKFAVAIYESGSGQSTPGNNHFGVRFASGKYRQYATAEDSWIHQSDVLTRPRYRVLYVNEDYKDWSRKLVECGYNRNEGYSVVLNKIIQQLDLTKYDKLAREIKAGRVSTCRITWCRPPKSRGGENAREICQVYREFPKSGI